MSGEKSNITLQRRPLIGILLAMTGGFLISLDIPVLRLAESNPWVVMFARGCGLAFSLGMILWIGEHRKAKTREAKTRTEAANSPFNDRDWVEIGVLYGVTMILFTFAVFNTSTANLVFILAFNPMLAALLAWWLIGERPSLLTWIAIALTGLGVLIIVGGGVSGGNLYGDMAALGAAVVLALSITRMRQSGKDMSLCGCLGGMVTAMFALPLALLHLEMPEAPGWLILNVLVLAPMAAFTLSLAPKFIPAPQVAMFFLLETVLTPIWVWLIFAEIPGTNTLYGGAIVLLAISVHSAVQIWKDMKDTAS